MNKIDGVPVSYLPGYQAGYQSGRKSAYFTPTATQKQKIVEEWLLEQLSELLLRKLEIDRQIALLEAEEKLRDSGFHFPVGFSSVSHAR